MAEFEIQESEYQRWVKIALRNETVRAEAGALSYMRGMIEVVAPLPSFGHAIKCKIADEPLIRPRYSGTGDVYLTSTFGGYHVFEVHDEPWILESGSYWASDDSVQLGLHRERMFTSFRAGEGFIDFQTKVSGRGRVVLNAAGPVEEIDLGSETISVEGKLVIARSAGVTYRVGNPTRSMFSYWLSGEEYVRRYTGPGRILLVSTPYFNWRMAAEANLTQAMQPEAERRQQKAALRSG